MKQTVIAMVLVLALCHALGGRDAVSVLSGTPPAHALQAPLGVLYAMSWLGTVLLAPPLVVALVIERWLDGSIPKRSA